MRILERAPNSGASALASLLRSGCASRLSRDKPYLGIGTTPMLSDMHAVSASCTGSISEVFTYFHIFLGSGAQFRNLGDRDMLCIPEATWNVRTSCGIALLEPVAVPWSVPAAQRIFAIGGELPGPLGYIRYRRDGDTAVSTSYFPLFAMASRKGFRGLSYAIELRTASEMRLRCVSYLSTDENSSEKRIRQLARVGICANAPFHITEWLAAMRRGIEMASSGSW